MTRNERKRNIGVIEVIVQIHPDLGRETDVTEDQEAQIHLVTETEEKGGKRKRKKRKSIRNLADIKFVIIKL